MEESCAGRELGCDVQVGERPVNTVEVAVREGVNYIIVVAHRDYDGDIGLRYRLSVTPLPNE